MNTPYADPTTIDNQILIDGLKRKGYKVKIRHFRPIIKGHKSEEIPYSRRSKLFDKNQVRVMGKGGATVAALVHSSGKIYVGKATCSKKDNFCYKVGARLAIEEALR